MLAKALEVWDLPLQPLDAPHMIHSAEHPEQEHAFVCNLQVMLTPACLVLAAATAGTRPLYSMMLDGISQALLGRLHSLMKVVQAAETEDEDTVSFSTDSRVMCRSTGSLYATSMETSGILTLCSPPPSLCLSSILAPF